MRTLILLLGAMPLLAQDDKPAPKVELRGVFTVEGISFTQGDKTKYTGDTYLLRLAFTDEKGEMSQPTPTLNFVVYNGQEPLKKVQRIITKEQWKADASKINKLSVADNTIACDKKTGELVVAFIRSDISGFEPRFDLTLEMRNVGTWVWKGVDRENEFKVPAKGPQPKK